MSVTGLYLEGSALDDLTGVFSMVVLTYLLAPFQGYAALKGLLERDEGGWIRTLKTGSITDRILRVDLSGLFGSILRPSSSTQNGGEQGGKVAAHVDSGDYDLGPTPDQRVCAVDAGQPSTQHRALA